MCRHEHLLYLSVLLLSSPSLWTYVMMHDYIWQRRETRCIILQYHVLSFSLAVSSSALVFLHYQDERAQFLKYVSIQLNSTKEDYTDHTQTRVYLFHQRSDCHAEYLQYVSRGGVVDEDLVGAQQPYERSEKLLGHVPGDSICLSVKSSEIVYAEHGKSMNVDLAKSKLTKRRKSRNLESLLISYSKRV